MTSVNEREVQNTNKAIEEVDAWFAKALPRLRKKALRNQQKGRRYEASIRFPDRFASLFGKYDRLGLNLQWMRSRAATLLTETYEEEHETSLVRVFSSYILSARIKR